MAKRIDELTPGDGVTVGDTRYEYGANLESDKATISDKGEGKIILVRSFQFAFNPLMDGKAVDKQDLFNVHAKQISTLLWADGLIPLQGESPRVEIDAKKRMYYIFITCEAKKGTVFADKPRNLAEELIDKRSLDIPVA